MGHPAKVSGRRGHNRSEVPGLGDGGCGWFVLKERLHHLPPPICLFVSRFKTLYHFVILLLKAMLFNNDLGFCWPVSLFPQLVFALFPTFFRYCWQAATFILICGFV